ncbi:DivIVA domain-containing protein [Vagococcus acidifermentans]|uniref:Cell division protein DivIVA n=1 Tax=Vagococcus acidifermentans TaxID=564710 RepID=A0A430AWR0_9ENTE|nr:DivIVA domain-containing protein [Vagococcus acidifermentans]RSU12483.1 cell division protein DivIVA [Vagococcus acidifermentans]
MSIKPIDITSKNFDSKLRGYDKNQVDDFLDQIALDFERAIQDNRELEKRIKHVEEKLNYFNELKDSLNQSIIVAQDTAEKLKENATRESDLTLQSAQAQSEDILARANRISEETIDEATTKANDILQEASNRAKQLAVETDDLKKKTRVFHRNLTMMLESQLELVKSDEWDDLLKPFGAYVDNTQTAFKEVLESVQSSEEGGYLAADDHEETLAVEEAAPELEQTITKTSVVFPDDE